MVRAKTWPVEKKPGFLWQALLISVPVLVLGLIGFFSLRQDRAIAEHDAAERAKEIAEDVLARFSSSFTNGDSVALESATLSQFNRGITNSIRTETVERSKHFPFEVSSSGELLFPPPFNRDPVPSPLNLAELPPEQQKLWNSFQQLEVSGASKEERLRACRAFMAFRPLPNSFWPVAGYSLGLLLMDSCDWQQAFDEFEHILSDYPDGKGESGVPLGPLCRLRLFEIGQSAPPTLILRKRISPEKLLSESMAAPTLLTEHLLRKIGEEATNDTVRNLSREWRQVWEEQEIARQCYSAWHQQTGATNAQLSWFRFGEDDLLAISMPTGWEPRLDLPLADESGGLPHVFLRGQNVTITGTGAPARRNNLSVLLPTEVAQQAKAPAKRWLMCRSEGELGVLFTSIIKTKKGIPDYFALGLEVAGKPVRIFAPQIRPWHQVYYGGKGGGSRKEYLDEAELPALASNVKPQVIGAATLSGADPELLKVRVYLTSPEVLFKRQTARSFWFGCLVASACLAAVIGLANAWRAFSHQHQLSEMKTNFVSSVSHELRAPIASIRLLAEGLERGRIQEAQKQKDYFRFIGQECRRLSSLIENVLDFSRIEQGRKEYEFEPTDLLGLVRETVALMQTYADEKRVRLELNVAEDVSNLKDQLSLDGRAIQQAVVNLIDNAIKHSPTDAIVTVALSAVGGLVKLSVEDHGPGIPVEEHEKIFERFYRTGSELRRESQGVGIGLSLVKHIVEAHGGQVRVRSAPGQGSAFHHRIADAENMERILIIEDELPMRVGLEDLLAAEGYRALTARDGEEGLARAVEQKPDLILLDIMLPKLDGFAVCGELRRLGNPVPILMLTAKGQLEDRVTGLDAGADDYLVKPFSTEELLARIRALLRRFERRQKPQTTLSLGQIKIDLIKQTAARGKTPIRLTPKEFAMLRLMADSPGEPVSREQFLDIVWGYAAFPTTRTVDNHIASLRGKLERDPNDPRWIKTVHGIGYKLEITKP